MPTTSQPPKIALVYDWLTTTHGGAEAVLLALHELLPDAPLYTSVYTPDATWAKQFKVKTTWLQKLPSFLHRHQLLAPFLGLAFESLDLSEFKLVISISSGPAKGILTLPQQKHLSYVLTPPRYLYSHRQHYLEQFQQPGRWFVDLLLKYLQWWDEGAAFRADMMIPISQIVGSRIEEYYHCQPASVIYPPGPETVSSTKIAGPSKKLPQLPEKFILMVNRLVSYKQVELAIRACQQEKRPLVIAGTGPLLPQLQQVIRSHPYPYIYLLGSVSESDRQWLYHSCAAVLMPGEEDFGIVGLEGLAAGKPVLVHQRSGVAEIVRNHQDGVHIETDSISAITTALHQLDTLKYQPSSLQKRAAEYNRSVFKEHWKHVISKHMTTLTSERTTHVTS